MSRASGFLLVYLPLISMSHISCCCWSVMTDRLPSGEDRVWDRVPTLSLFLKPCTIRAVSMHNLRGHDAQSHTAYSLIKYVSCEKKVIYNAFPYILIECNHFCPVFNSRKNPYTPLDIYEFKISSYIFN